MRDICCKSCGKELVRRWPAEPKTYCSNKCQRDWQSKERTRQWLEEGKDWGLQIPQWAKAYLATRDGSRCSVCKRKTWNGKEIPLECDHIDGNHVNNDESNLRLICPNCHAQTDTYKAKNMGNGRESRRKLH